MWTSEAVIQTMKTYGKRMTRQRMIIIEAVVSSQSGNFKDLYTKISKEDPNIGPATVYRMLQVLEEVGVLKRVQGYILN